MTSQQKIVSAFVAFVLIIGTGVYYATSTTSLAAGSPADTTQSQGVQTSPTTDTSAPATAAAQTQHTTATQTTGTSMPSTKNLSTSVTFQVPENHTDTLTVSATVDPTGTVSNITFDQNSSNRESREYYSGFTSSFSNSMVVGKNITNISLSRVGGASLTTAAFNQALSQIAAQL